LRCSAARSVLSCLLAGFILTSTLPSSAFLRAALGEAMGVASESEDSLPNDTEMPEGENSSDEFGFEATTLPRAQFPCGRSGTRASRIHLPSTVLAASQPRPWWLIRFDARMGHAGHFLAEGRALRLWVQSQTC
jgi:hypothetical protein